MSDPIDWDDEDFEEDEFLWDDEDEDYDTDEEDELTYG